jgi:hypothetical protein
MTKELLAEKKRIIKKKLQDGPNKSKKSGGHQHGNVRLC